MNKQQTRNSTKKLKTLDRSQKIRLIALLKEKKRRKANTNLLDFTRYTMPTFKAAEFHKVYYKVLDLFAEGKIKNLMITMPPQHGKSEGSTRRLPAFLLGKNPDLKIAVGSYNATFARKFNRDIQRIIDTPEYHKLFPKTVLNESNVVTISDSYLRNSEEFEVVGSRGSLKAVGRGGGLTGNSVDIMIMDDLYKDYAEGNSPVVREAVTDWYTTVVKTRLHNDSQQLIVFTRWHEEDLIGTLEAEGRVVEIKSLDEIEDIDHKMFIKINFEAIMEQEASDLDQRSKGEALWPDKHSLEKLKDDKGTSPATIEKFNCLYQGDPISAEGLMYSKFKTYKQLPVAYGKKNYTDTADAGDDYLCSLSYIINGDYFYITGAVYTDEDMEETEETVPQMILRVGTKEADVESNNGGRAFARQIQKAVRGVCKIDWFYQGANKESRIKTNRALVEEHIIWPEGWASMWPVLYKHLTRYKKLFKANKQDGAPDVLTGIIEKNQKRSRAFI